MTDFYMYIDDNGNRSTIPFKFMDELRCYLAEYIYSEGCGCCEDHERHEEYANKLGKLLNVPKYKDGSGHNFSLFLSK